MLGEKHTLISSMSSLTSEVPLSFIKAVSKKISEFTLINVN